MKEIELSELKSIQIEIMKVVHDYCVSNNISYSLAYGSLIGAIRHKGFIPWDDDIDILMPREDYSKFIQGFNSSCSRYQVRSHHNFEGYPFPFAKVEDTFTLKDELGYTQMGIAIDVFPIDNVPDEEIETTKVFNKSQQLRAMNQLKFMRWSKSRSVSKNLFLYLSKIPLLFVPNKWINKQYEENSTRFNTSPSQRKACLIAVYKRKEIMPARVFEEYIDCDFEDQRFKILKEYHNYLTNLYGDYMKLPPEDKRVTHHDFKAWWKD